MSDETNNDSGQERKKRKYNNRYDFETKKRIMTDICEAYKNGNHLETCCKAHGISHTSFYYWKAKHPELKQIYDDAIAQMNHTKYDILRELAESAMIRNLRMTTYTETTEIEEDVPVKRNGRIIDWKKQKKVIKEKKVRFPSASLAAKIAFALDKNYRQQEDAPIDDIQVALMMQKRQEMLEERLKALREKEEEDNADD